MPQTGDQLINRCRPVGEQNAGTGQKQLGDRLEIQRIGLQATSTPHPSLLN